MNTILTFGQYAAVEVPDSLPEIDEYYDQASISESNTLWIVSSDRGLLPPVEIPLPEGKWEIFGRFSILMEENVNGPTVNSLLIAAGGNPDSDPIILKQSTHNSL